MNRRMMVAWVGVALAGFHSSMARAQGAFESEIKIYHVLTKITWDSSRGGSPCDACDIRYHLEEQLDDVALTMKGRDLTWNGAKEPDHPLIHRVGVFHIMLPREDPAGSIGATSATEYFDMEDGHYVVRRTGSELGLRMEFRLTHEPGVSEDLFVNDYRLDFSYIKERASLPGVETLDVGKPVIESLTSSGKWQFRVGEWSCLRLNVPSKGKLYVFVRTVATFDTNPKPKKP